MVKVSDEEYIQAKELIAAIIFDYDYDSLCPDGGYGRPHEEDCHAIAEEILEAFGFEIE